MVHKDVSKQVSNQQLLAKLKYIDIRLWALDFALEAKAKFELHASPFPLRPSDSQIVIYKPEQDIPLPRTFSCLFL